MHLDFGHVELIVCIAERSDFSKRNESKYEASYFNEIDNKFEEELSSHKYRNY